MQKVVLPLLSLRLLSRKRCWWKCFAEQLNRDECALSRRL